MKLSEVSELFDQKVLNELRSGAGGIQTVLKNSQGHQVFKGKLASSGFAVLFCFEVFPE